MLPPLVDRIHRYVGDASTEAFAPLAAEAFAFQHAAIAPFRTLCERRGASPGSIQSWRDVPLVPAAAFATLELSAADGGELFRSSGTLDPRRSVHRHPFPELYREVIDAAFGPACLPEATPLPILSLIPDRELAPDSSLSFLADHVVRRHGAPGSVWAIGSRGVDVRAARSWVAGRQRDGRPALVLATGFALLGLLDALERQNLRFRLPPGSRIFETGGLKGRTREASRSELLDAVEERLGVSRAAVVREYGMTELTSHFYTAALRGGDPDLFLPLPWTRVRALDPVTLAELPEGETGLLAIFDLANVGSALHLLTEDLGSREGEGFRLSGRAEEAQLRGCSLTVEDLGG